MLVGAHSGGRLTAHVRAHAGKAVVVGNWFQHPPMCSEVPRIADLAPQWALYYQAHAEATEGGSPSVAEATLQWALQYFSGAHHLVPFTLAHKRYLSATHLIANLALLRLRMGNVPGMWETLEMMGHQLAQSIRYTQTYLQEYDKVVSVLTILRVEAVRGGHCQRDPSLASRLDALRDTWTRASAQKIPAFTMGPPLFSSAHPIPASGESVAWIAPLPLAPRPVSLVEVMEDFANHKL